MMCDPYPNETLSFNNIPPENPLHFLPYGIMETIISPLVSEFRKKYRVKQINEMCQDMDAYKLKYILEDFSHIDKHNYYYCIDNKRSTLRSKKACMEYILKIPMVYLKEYLSLIKNNDINVGDNVEVKDYRNGGTVFYWGVVKEVRDYSCMITHVKTRHHGKLSYPDFSHYETWKDRNVLIGYNDTGDGKTVSMNMIKMETRCIKYKARKISSENRLLAYFREVQHRELWKTYKLRKSLWKENIFPLLEKDSYYKKLTTDEKHFIVSFWFDMRFNPLNKSNDSLDWNILFDDFNYMYKQYFNWVSSRNLSRVGVGLIRSRELLNYFKSFLENNLH